MRKFAWVPALFLLAAAASAGAAASGPNAKAVEHGRKLAVIAGCHDCHTPGWGQNGAPTDVLLIGGGLAFQGPWGTTYPINLRLFVQSLTVDQWTRIVRTTKARPLMPWWVFQSMSDYDVASLYYYIRSLGPAGKPAPEYQPPGAAVPPPYLKLIMPPPASTGAGAAH